MSVKTPRILAPVISPTCSQQFVTALGDVNLTQPLHHFDHFRGLGKLTFSRSQNTFRPEYNQIPCDQRTNFVRPPNS